MTAIGQQGAFWRLLQHVAKKDTGYKANTSSQTGKAVSQYHDHDSYSSAYNSPPPLHLNSGYGIPKVSGVLPMAAMPFST